MPFCDESHKRTGFDGTETASLVPYARQAEEFDGPTLVLSDVKIFVPLPGFAIREVR